MKSMVKIVSWVKKKRVNGLVEGNAKLKLLYVVLRLLWRQNRVLNEGIRSTLSH